VERERKEEELALGVERQRKEEELALGVERQPQREGASSWSGTGGAKRRS